MSPEQARRIAALGTALTPEVFAATAGMFAAEALRPGGDCCAVTRDVAYGPDPRHRLDIFAPVAAAVDRPVLVFVHGGGFVRGDKGEPDDPYYNNLGAWAAGCGFVGVNMTYRLAPGAQWPAGAEDIATALRWLKGHVAASGGDAGRIVLMGQSAGAVHVASYVAGHHGGTDDTLLAGAVMLSGLYDLTRLDHSDFERAYFGADPAGFAARSSIAALARTPLPLLFGVAEFDPDSFQHQAMLVSQATRSATGRLPRLLYLLGHNHLSPLCQIGLPGDSLGPQLRQFITHLPSLRPGDGPLARSA